MISGVILAAGQSSRMVPIGQATSKVLLPIKGKSLIQYGLDALGKLGGWTVIVVRPHVENIMAQIQHPKVLYFYDYWESGTGGPISDLASILSNPVVVMCGDLYTNIDLESHLVAHRAHKEGFTIIVRDWMNPSDGVVHVEGNKVIGFEEKAKEGKLGNTGIYILDPTLLMGYMKGWHLSVEYVVIPQLVAKGLVYASHLQEGEFCVGINTWEEYLNYCQGSTSIAGRRSA